MPRASMNPDKAKQGGGGVEAGNYEVVSAKYQNIKTDFRANQLYLVFDCAVLDKDGDRVRSADNVEIDFSFGAKSLESFHPGSAKGVNDEPNDEGEGVDAEGNTIYCEAGAQFNKSCGAMVFAETLVKAGFPKDVLDQTWAPSFVGLKFRLETKTPKEVNDRFGLRLNTKPMKNEKGEESVVTYKVCDKWLNPNYLSGSTASGKTNGKAVEEAAGDGAKLSDPEEIAKAVLVELAAARAGKGPIKTKAQLSGYFSNQFPKSQKANMAKLGECKKLLADDDWLIGAIAEVGGTYEDGVTTFE